MTRKVWLVAYSEIGDYDRLKETKIFLSSITRSLFEGRVVCVNNRAHPIFSVMREGVIEVSIETSSQGYLPLADVLASQKIGEDDWIMAVDTGSLAMRNFDHLIPVDSFGPYGAKRVELYYTRHVDLDKMDVIGPWAVRFKYLDVADQIFKALREPVKHDESVREKWFRLISESGLTKKSFESREIYAPLPDRVDLKRLHETGVVVLSNWPEDQRWFFLQAIYFATYFGDQTGTVLSLVDA